MKMVNQPLTTTIHRSGSLKLLLRRRVIIWRRKCSLHAIQSGTLKLDQDFGALKEGETMAGKTGSPRC